MSILASRLGLLGLCFACAVFSTPACSRGDSGGVRRAETVAEQPLVSECNRNEVALRDLRQHTVPCMSDDTCPAGSYCDEAAGMCQWDCLQTDSSYGVDCAAGLTCDCYGRCLDVGGGSVIASLPLQKGVLQIEKPVITLPHDDAGELQAATLDVRIVFSAGSGGEGAAATLELMAPDGFLMACAEGVWLRQCKLSDWQTEGTTNGVTILRGRAWVRAASSSPPGVSPWFVRYHSPTLTPSSGRVSLLLPQPMAAGMRAQDGEYMGAASLVPVGDTDPAHAMTLPLKAWVRRDTVLLFDPSVSLLPRGRMVLSIKGASEGALPWTPRTVPGGTTGELVGAWRADAFTVEENGISLLGNYVIQWSFGTQTWRLRLRRVADLQADTCDTGVCKTGSCQPEVGLCGPLGPWRPEKTSSVNLLRHQTHDAWAALPLRRVVNKGLYEAIDGDGVTVVVQGRRSAERLQCSDAKHPATEFGHHLSKRSGDLLCAGGHPSRAMPLLTDGDAGPEIPAWKMIHECRADLARRPPPVGGIDDPSVGAAVGAILEDRKCISLGRFFWALQAVQEAGPTSDDGLASRHFVRYLQQWLALHSFLANETLRESDLRDLLQRGEQSGDIPSELRDLPPVEVLAAEWAAAWQLFLDRDVSAALLKLSPELLRFPDLRSSYGVGTRASDDQMTGLPVSMLESLADYLRVLIARVNQAHKEGFGQCGTAALRHEQRQVHRQIQEDLRIIRAGQALATSLFEQAKLGQTRLPWQQRYNAAFGEYAGSHNRLQGLLASLGTCAAPWGLGNEEMPLYFGDVVGTNGRFFASSDYLLDRYAKPAVTQAQIAYTDTVRTQWMGFLSNGIQEDVRLEDLQARYRRPIVEACGLSDAEAVTALERVASNALSLDTCFIRPGCPGGIEDVRCFRGSLGDAAALVVGAKQDVDIARSAASDLEQAYELEAQYCGQLQADLEHDNRILDHHETEMKEWRNWKMAADQVANACATASEVMSAKSVISLGAGLDAAAGASRAASIHFQHKMNAAESEFRKSMALRSNARQVQSCFHGADKYRLGMATESLKIQRRATDVEIGLASLQSKKESARQLVAEGIAAIGREGGRTHTSSVYRHWLSADVEMFRQDFDWAQRMTYLALRALEYELQESSSLRQAVVTARQPQELRNILMKIEGALLPRKINERRPEPHKLVLSMREQVLHLADQSTAPAGKRHGTSVERFRHYLTSPAAAIYDAEGRYVGQGVHFSVPSQAADECAERLWLVNAVVRGHFSGEAAGFTRVQIYKTGVFASQWCVGHGTSLPLQIGATPRMGVASYAEAERRPLPQTLSGFSQANLDSRRDVEYAHFSESSYSDGASEGFAGQGLYGDYLLVFPPNGNLPLSEIEDVFLRFDYLSVPNGAGETRP